MLVLTEQIELVDNGLLIEKLVLNYLLYEFNRRLNRNLFVNNLTNLLILSGFKNMILAKKNIDKMCIYDIKHFAEMKLYSEYERLKLNRLLEAITGRRELFDTQDLLILYLFIDFEEIINLYLIRQEKRKERKYYERNYI
jgi:hypothetical protein